MMREIPPLLPLVGSDLTRFAAVPLSRNSNATASSLPARPCRSSFPTFPPPTYYAVDPHNAEGKARSPLASCKSFSGHASEVVADLRSTLGPQSVAESSSFTARHMTTIGEQEDSDDQLDRTFFSIEKNILTTSTMTAGNLAPSTHKRPTSCWTTCNLN